MNGDSSEAVLVAVKAALGGNPAIAALVGNRVFDWPGSGSTFPCIVIGQIEHVPWDTDDTEGAELALTINVWAKGTSARAEARQIGRAVNAALHRQEAALSVPDHTVELLEATTSRVERVESPDVLAHGVYSFRVLTEARNS